MSSKAKGGITKGKSHAEGGMPMVVKSTGQKVELEGGEGVINKKNMADTQKHEFEGKMLTKCEIASEINSDGGNGVEIDCDGIVGKKYKHQDGGRLAEVGDVKINEVTRFVSNQMMKLRPTESQLTETMKWLSNNNYSNTGKMNERDGSFYIGVYIDKSEDKFVKLVEYLNSKSIKYGWLDDIEFKVGEEVGFDVPYFESFLEYRGKIISDKGSHLQIKYYEPLYDKMNITDVEYDRVYRLSKFAKGGEVIFTDVFDAKPRSYKIWETRKSKNTNENSFGAFAHRYNDRYKGDYYLYRLSQYDEDFYSHIPLKEGEILARVETDNMIGGEMPLVKININNGRVYFMSDENNPNSDEDNKNPKFNRASADVIYLSLDESTKDYEKFGYDKHSRYTYAEGGDVKMDIMSDGSFNYGLLNEKYLKSLSNEKRLSLLTNLSESGYIIPYKRFILMSNQEALNHVEQVITEQRDNQIPIYDYMYSDNFSDSVERDYELANQNYILYKYEVDKWFDGENPQQFLDEGYLNDWQFTNDIRQDYIKIAESPRVVYYVIPYILDENNPKDDGFMDYIAIHKPSQRWGFFETDYDFNPLQIEKENGVLSFTDFETNYAKGGEVSKEYMVFNYTDNIYASNQTFNSVAEANKFIKDFRKRFEAQGYYRDNRRNKISPEHIDLEVIDETFSPYGFAKGGQISDESEIIVKAILSKKPKYKVFFNTSTRCVNIGGVGYCNSEIPRAFNVKMDWVKIKNAFNRASKEPQRTIREVEKLSNGQIKVNKKYYLEYDYVNEYAEGGSVIGIQDPYELENQGNRYLESQGIDAKKFGVVHYDGFGKNSKLLKDVKGKDDEGNLNPLWMYERTPETKSMTKGFQRGKKIYAEGGDIDGFDETYNRFADNIREAFGQPRKNNIVRLESDFGFKKSELPQLRTKDKGLFVKMLVSKYGANVVTQDINVKAKLLKPIQSEINLKQVEVIARVSKGKMNPNKPITISKDGYIIDGHHRWYYARQNDLDISVLQINLDANKVIDEIWQSGLAEKEDIDSVRKKVGGKI